MFYPVKPNGEVPAPPEHTQRKAPSYRKAMWSQSEDQLLLAAVNKFGTNNWGVVASEVRGRTGKQCRERWAGILNPALAKQPWTEEEDELLKNLHSKYGNKWAQIAVHIKGRSTIALRNRWSWHVRHAQSLAKAANQQKMPHVAALPAVPPQMPQPMPLQIPPAAPVTVPPMVPQRQPPVRMVIPPGVPVQEGVDEKPRWAYPQKLF